MNYDMIDRFLRNNLGDDDYAEYSAALDALCTPQPKEPEQEPVAWMNDSTPSGIFARHIDGAKNFGCTIPLYTTPPQRKPLTDEDLRKLADKHLFYQPEGYEVSGVFVLARAIEAAHGIKE